MTCSLLSKVLKHWSRFNAVTENIYHLIAVYAVLKHWPCFKTLTEYIAHEIRSYLDQSIDWGKNVLLVSHLEIKFPKNKKPRVAIIGGGMSGASTAYWLNLIGNGQIDLQLFEENNIGGRVQTTKFCGHDYECGGTIMHESNTFALYFSKLFNMNVKPAKDGSKCIVVKSIEAYAKGENCCGGSNVVFHEYGPEWFTKIRLIMKYGMMSMFEFSNQINTMLTGFKLLYPLLNSGVCFSRPQDLLSAAVPSSVLTINPLKRSEIINEGDSKNLFRKEFGAAAARCNYGQTSLPEFTYLVSAAGSQSEKLFSVQGGNSRIAFNLIRASGARVSSQRINSITSSSQDNGGSSSKWLLNEDESMVHSMGLFDAVVIANPLETSNMILNGQPISSSSPSLKLGMKQVHVTFVQGILKQRGIANIFACDCEKEQSPENMGVIHSVGILVPVDYSDKEGKEMVQQAMKGASVAWKIFSSESIVNDKHQPNTILSSIFESISECKEVAQFKAYPQYDVTESQDSQVSLKNDSFYSFVNHLGGVFSTCPIERTASAIEMALISGKNSAMLVREHLIASSLTLQK